MQELLKVERWKYVPTFEGVYEVSDQGRVHNIRSNKILKPDGRNIRLQSDGRSESYMIPVLMACAFLGLDITDPYRNRVLFKDGDSSNITLSNIYIEDTSSWPGEEWRAIKEVSGKPLKDHYYVSNLGRVKRQRHELTWLNHGKPSVKYCPDIIVSQTKNDNGYFSCPMTHASGKDMTVQVHRLIATAFCENSDPEHKIQVNHIDGNPSNNKASNLEWVTPSENSTHAVKTGLRGPAHETLRYPVIREETGVLYNSLSDVDRALGYNIGYTHERLKHNKPITDSEGSTWTLRVLKGTYVKVGTEGQHCTIDEIPGKEFISLSEASAAIGRWEGYISDALTRGGIIRNKAGQEMHVRLIGEAPVVGANEAYTAKKEAGLIPEAKKRKRSEWSPKKPVRCIQTGEVFASMSAADRAMGKKVGYLKECFAFDRDFIDADGNKRTFEFVDDQLKIPETV